MKRLNTAGLAIGLLIVTSLACNAFAGAVEPALTLPPPPTLESPATAAPGTGGAAATATLETEGTSEVTPDASAEALITVLVDLNVRGGPGVQYDRVSFLLKGEQARIIGHDPATGWWKIECPPRAAVTECWVSGGAKYSAAENADGVPVVAVPPTPTPVPPTPEPDTGLLAYADAAGVWLARLDMSQNPPTAGEPAKLADAAGVGAVLISPDGGQVAYLAESGDVNALYLVGVDGGDARKLVEASDLPVAAEGDTSTLAAAIHDVQWLADGRTLAFNTDVVNLVGPGTGPQEDLWLVTADGALTEQFPAGTGGGTFAISPQNRVILGQSEFVIRVNLDGSERETVIPFDFVNTASEYAFVPQAQWTADGSAAYVAIPSADPFSPDASAALWRIPAAGPAESLESLPGGFLFDPVLWSPDGSALTYIFHEMDVSNPPPVLMIADGAGHDPGPYVTIPQLALFGWSQNNLNFLFAGDGYYGVGQAGALPTETLLPAGQIAAAGRWLTETSFVVAAGSGNAWTLSGGNLSGATAVLVEINGVTNPPFDVWAP
ncbi:MAG: hypothetical protein ACE5E7_01200 [Anaerolineae bacterium]